MAAAARDVTRDTTPRSADGTRLERKTSGGGSSAEQEKDKITIVQQVQAIIADLTVALEQVRNGRGGREGGRVKV